MSVRKTHWWYISTCIYRQIQQCPKDVHFPAVRRRFVFVCFLPVRQVLTCFVLLGMSSACSSKPACNASRKRSGLARSCLPAVPFSIGPAIFFSHVSFLLPKEKSSNTSSNPQYMHIVETSFGQYIQKLCVHGIKSVHSSHAMLTPSCRPKLQVLESLILACSRPTWRARRA